MWIADLRIVLPDRVLPRGAVRVEDGRIAEVIEVPSFGARPAALTLVPGPVDLHGDMIEKEVEPRPDCAFPLEVAVGNLDSRLAAAGATTAFAGVSFAEGKRGLRSEERARALVEAIVVEAADEDVGEHVQPARHLGAVLEDAAGAGIGQAVDEAEQGGLARAGTADDADEGAARHLQADVVHSGPVAEAAGQSLDDQHAPRLSGPSRMA